MNTLKYSILGLFLSANIYSVLINNNFQTDTIHDELIATWQIDLRPTPDSEAYYKDFVIESLNGKTFSGEFYDTKFNNGYINTSWDKIYFGFTTKDASSTYFHSGSIAGNKIEGTTYSPEREFTSYWTGTKKK